MDGNAGRGGRGRSNGRWQGQRPQWRGGRGRGRGRGRGGGRGRDYDGRSSFASSYQDEIEEIGESSSTSLSIAIEGCCHGELDAIYDRLQQHEKKTGKAVDLLLCCGDFQSLRNPADFHSCAIPPKYRRLGTFPQYYFSERKAPILTIFIGGNHEASQPLRELHYGGWVAPNIYYLGSAGVVRFGGLRIGGLSGIYKSHDYSRGHFERPPFDRSTTRSVYHVRNLDVFRLKCLSHSQKRLDIFLSHDWPVGVAKLGNTRELLRKKPFFRQEVEDDCLGSPPNREILNSLQPKWWFSAHLHVKFKAVVRHSQTNQSSSPELPSREMLIPSQVSPRPIKNPEDKAGADPEPSINDDVNETNFHAVESDGCRTMSDLTAQMTEFLALDKCLPRRQYLAILHIPPSEGIEKEEAKLEFDPEWLAIVAETHQLTSTSRSTVVLPEQLHELQPQSVQSVKEQLLAQSDTTGLEIPLNFSPTVPHYKDPMYHTNGRGECPKIPFMGNPQTDRLLQTLQIEHIITTPFVVNPSRSVNMSNAVDDNEIDIDSMEDVVDDNEIDIDSLEEEEEEEKDEKTEAASVPPVDASSEVKISPTDPVSTAEHVQKKARSNSPQ